MAKFGQQPDDGGYIYALCNRTTRQIYIGATTDWDSRFVSHLRDLRSTRHGNKKLNQSYIDHGANSFFAVILGEAGPKDAFVVEGFVIGLLGSSGRLFNSCYKLKQPECCLISKKLDDRSRAIALKVRRWLDGEDVWSPEEETRFENLPEGRLATPVERKILSASQIARLSGLAEKKGMKSWEEYLVKVVDDHIYAPQKKIIPDPVRLNFLKPGEVADPSIRQKLRERYSAQA